MKNPAHVVTVTKEKHAKTRIKQNVDFAHAKELNLAAVMITELSAATANFPVIFIQHPETKVVRPVAMFGLKPGENYFYGKDGWDATYVPLLIQRHPFLIGADDANPDSTSLTMCIDSTSPYLTEDADGIALFDANGNGTDFLGNRNELLREIFEGERITEQFTRKVQELGLLKPFEILVQEGDGSARKITGLMTFDEVKLRQLPDDKVLELNKLDFLAACYVIYGSLFQIHRMMQLRNRKLPSPLNYRIELNPQAQQPQPAQ
ncbi:MAG: SapC family protein [Pseudomonadota bacterium]|nr:SapC family protein [Pseudomonadota bacterium]